ncbi:hypothetical protein [Cupriavidus sp. a3]|uniref:hypothetical protein n=1 Tax=Cupriavidus sp. a3 TaxID=3242158 RepID=UPI003D9C0143
MQISKLDAARNQLRTAIWLYFHEMDPISIHALASAARMVLRKLHVHHKTGHKMLHDELIDVYVKAEYRGSMINVLNSAANFFKHADQDPEDVYHFNPKASEMVMLDAVFAIGVLGAEDCDEFRAYRTWMLVMFPHLLKELPEGISEATLASARSVGRREYFRLIQQQIAALASRHQGPIGGRES